MKYLATNSELTQFEIVTNQTGSHDGRALSHELVQTFNRESHQLSKFSLWVKVGIWVGFGSVDVGLMILLQSVMNSSKEPELLLT